MGVYAQWQPEYAAHGIITFPVVMDGGRKQPAVSGYLKLGAKVSQQLTLKFSQHNGIGLACKRNRITVLDVDTNDERVLADGLAEHGPTPFIVRSGSGNFQAWYRNNGEKRRIRPKADVPIDILGDGYVVAPPSLGAKGPYEIIQGTMDDLDRLPRMLRRKTEDGLAREAQPQAPQEAKEDSKHIYGKIHEGTRSDTLWRHCMKAVRSHPSFEHLMEVAMSFNTTKFYEPLPDVEVLRVVASAMTYEREGKNWFGHGARIIIDADQVDTLMMTEPDAFMLLTVLRRHHWGRNFTIANGMADVMPGGGWPRKRFSAARNVLIERAEIEMLRPASSFHGPALFKFGHGQK